MILIEERKIPGIILVVFVFLIKVVHVLLISRHWSLFITTENIRKPLVFMFRLFSRGIYRKRPVV